MKKTMRLLTMASLTVAGAVMADCSGSDDIIDNPQPPTQKDNVVTVTTTVGLAAGGGEEGGATTRAESRDGREDLCRGRPDCRNI